MLTISQQESLVVFNSKTKRFEETTDFKKACQLFTSAPEGWYIVLKNPAEDNSHPESGKAVSPYFIANGESIADTVSTLLRGSKLEDTLNNIKSFKIN